MKAFQKMILLLFYSGLILISSSASEERTTELSREHSGFSDRGIPSYGDKSLLSSVTFDCTGRVKGYYADKDFDCVVFHYCDGNNEKYSYRCKDGKKFDEITETCTYRLKRDCTSRIGLWNKDSSSVSEESTSTTLGSNTIKRGELAFSTNNYRTKLDQEKSADESLGALSAFASLTHNSDKKKYEDDSKFSGRDKDERVSHTDHAISEKSGKQLMDHVSHVSLNNKPRDSLYTDISWSDRNVPLGLDIQPSDNIKVFDNYRPLPDDLKGAASRHPFATTFSYSHPTALGRNNFDYYPSVTESYNNPNNYFQIAQNSGPLGSGNTVKKPTQSHFNFNPPNSKSSFNQQNSKKTIHDTVEFRGSLHREPNYSIPSTLIEQNPSNTPIYHPVGPTISPNFKTSSVFNAGTPRSVPTSTSVSNIFQRKLTSGNQETHAIYTDGPFKHPFDDYPQYNQPLFYEHPISYQGPLHSPNYPLYDGDHYSIDPYHESPGFSQFHQDTDIQDPGVSFRHDFSQPTNINSPVKTSQKTVKLSKTSKIINKDNTRLLSGQSRPSNAEKQPEFFVNKNPIIHVTTSPKHIETRHKPYDKKENFIFKDVGEELEDYAPGITENIFGDRAKPDTDENYIKSIKHKVDVTTYSPPLTQNVKENPVDAVSKPRRPIRRKNERFKNRLSSRRQNLLPKQETQDNKEPVNIPATVEENRELENQSKNTTVKTETVSITTLKPNIKPSRSSFLRGSLKDRLNRLSTRRKITTRERLRPGNKFESATNLTPNNDKNNTNLTEATFQPEEGANKKAKENEAIVPTTSKRLKNRVTGLYTSKTRNRRPQRPLRKRLNENNRTTIKKENTGGGSVETSTPFNTETTKDRSESSQLRRGIKRRRPLNPEVRARFKEFLKTRKSHLNLEKISKETEPIETQKTPAPENGLVKTENNQTAEVIPTKQTSEVPENIDSLTNESEKMEKSIPLVREEKVILLLDPFQNPSDVRQKRLSDATTTFRSKFNHEKQNILSHPSAKPFRYMLKNYENQEGEHGAFNSPTKAKEAPSESLAEKILKLKTHSPQSKVTTAKSNNNGITESTKQQLPNLPFTVVRPSNFKQIVKMHPQTPSAVTSTSTIIPTTIGEKENPPFPPAHENEVYSLEVSASSTDQTKVETNEDYKRKQKTNSEPIMSESNDSEIMDGSNDESISGNGSKPVFNLDAVAETINSNSKVPHISALESDSYKTKISAIKFEPFSLSNEEPLLPIQRLLQIK